jgi:hypothetical protein
VLLYLAYIDGDAATNVAFYLLFCNHLLGLINLWKYMNNKSFKTSNGYSIIKYISIEINPDKNCIFVIHRTGFKKIAKQELLFLQWTWRACPLLPSWAGLVKVRIGANMTSCRIS